MYQSDEVNLQSRSFQQIEVRVGDDDPGTTYSSIQAANEFCSAFRNKGESMKYYDFKCPNIGLMGKYITISSTFSGGTDANWDFLMAAEVELFGNFLYLSKTQRIYNSLHLIGVILIMMSLFSRLSK